VADLVWVFFVHAGECQISEPVSHVDVKMTCVLGRGAYRED